MTDQEMKSKATLELLYATEQLKKAWIRFSRACSDAYVECNDYIADDYPFDKSFDEIDTFTWFDSIIKNIKNGANKVLSMTVYCDSTRLFTEEECETENLTDLYFPEYLVRAFYMVNHKDTTREGYETWRTEYTAGDTEDLCDFCRIHGFEPERG